MHVEWKLLHVLSLELKVDDHVQAVYHADQPFGSIHGVGSSNEPMEFVGFEQKVSKL